MAAAMGRKPLIAGALFTLASVLLIYGGLAYELDVALGLERINWPFGPTWYHPTIFQVHLAVALLTGGLLAYYSVAIFIAPDRARLISALALVTSAVAMGFGDQFWLGGGVGIVGTIAGFLYARGP